MPSTQQLTQQHRHIAIGTPLGDDVLLLQSATVSEGLSQLFHMKLECLSEQDDIAFDDIVGENVTVRVALPNDETRYFNGYVSRFTQLTGTRRLARYELEVVPWLWFMTRTSDCRIFQEKTVTDIVKEVMKDFGYTDVVERGLAGNYRTWIYCVQYRETAYQFITRLLQQEGLYYFFEHENGKHSMVLADDISAHSPYPGYDELAYRAARSALRHGEFLFDWTSQMQVNSGAYALNDFDFIDPFKTLQTQRTIARPHGGSEFELFDHPGEYEEYTDGEQYARIRVEEAQADHEVHHGSTNARGIAAGCKITMKDLPRADRNQEYLVTHAVHSFETDSYDSQDAASGSGAGYTCNFACIPESVTFRPPRTTPKPLIYGCQTAIVTGPGGDEINTDEYGRVQVQFHWDRRSKGGEDSSCWIRVAQGWAGKKWGSLFHPRIGQEVIVAFIEGDPDRPIIVGRVYNGANMIPYPDNTMSTVKSNSTKGGGGFNEIRYEDKKGSERIFIHGEKDLDVRIKADRRESIGNDRHLTVEKKKHEHIKEDKHITVDGNHNEKVKQTISIEAGINKHVKVGVGYALKATTIDLKADAQINLQAPMINIKADGMCNIDGGGMLVLKGGVVMINSGGSAGSAKAASPDPPDPPDGAITGEPGEVAEPAMTPQPPQPVTWSSSAEAMQMAADTGAPFTE